MKIFTAFWFLSLLLVVTSEAPTPSNGGVYIVYTGAAAVSSSDSTHILSPESMKRWDDRVIHKYENGFSGFAARLSEEEAEEIAQRPEVVSVFPDTVLKLHSTRSWDFLKEMSGPIPRPTSKSSSSLSDQDVIIGILDTGIWPEAKSFNDIGIGPIPKKWKGKCIQGPDFKCNRKLIGARNYVANSTSARDYNGHGTHVAGIAAGRLVPGASYNGLAGGTAQGGSPGSRIAVYRVCSDLGCTGSAVLRAFDDAIADGVDIISISFGSVEYDDYTKDPIAVGAFHAAEAGILVVASAGEAVLDIENSWVRAGVPWILTVGASTIDRLFESDVVLGGNKVIKARGIIQSSSFQKTPVHPLIDGFSAKKVGAQDSEARDCYPGTLDGTKVKGKIVVCETERSDAAFGQGGRNEVITKLGGIGVIAVDYYGYVDSVYSSSKLVVVARESKDQILSYINSTRKPVATISPTVTIANYKPAPSLASSLYYRHPKTANYSISETLPFPGDMPSPVERATKAQPDVLAPGVDIMSAWPSNVTDQAFNIMSGTSVACPHVTGIAATVKSRYPSWSPSAIKSAIMTTARQTDNMNATIGYNYGGFGGSGGLYELGAGEVTLSGPMQPGLVYDTEIADYLHFLCNKGYDESRIKLISSKLPLSFSCPRNSSSELVPDLNYPWIIARGDGKTVRTVTNVGEEEEAVYVSSVEISDKNVKVEVNPSKLVFTKKVKKLSYQVKFSLYDYNVDAYTVFGGGSITWSNGKHRVRIPVNLIFTLRP